MLEAGSSSRDATRTFLNNNKDVLSSPDPRAQPNFPRAPIPSFTEYTSRPPSVVPAASNLGAHRRPSQVKPKVQTTDDFHTDFNDEEDLEALIAGVDDDDSDNEEPNRLNAAPDAIPAPGSKNSIVDEDEEDSSLISVEKLKKTIPEPVAWDWSIADLYACIKKDGIELNPSYQREVVWNKQRMQNLISSLMTRYYVPPIIFNVKKVSDESDKWFRVVIDGKQRLSSIKRFLEGEIPFVDSRGVKWYISGKKPRLPKQVKEYFLSIRLLCVEYADLTSDQEEEMFSRVQLGVPLTAAEKLQAMSTSVHTVARELLKRYPNVEALIDMKRQRGLQVLIIVLAQMKKSMESNSAATLVSGGHIIKFCRDSSNEESVLSPPFRMHIVKVFDRLNELVVEYPDTFTHAWGDKSDKSRRFAPVEFLGVCILLGRNLSHPSAQLNREIVQMRIFLRSEFNGNLRMHSRVWNKLSMYVLSLNAAPNTMLAESAATALRVASAIETPAIAETDTIVVASPRSSRPSSRANSPAVSSQKQEQGQNGHFTSVSALLRQAQRNRSPDRTPAPQSPQLEHQSERSRARDTAAPEESQVQSPLKRPFDAFPGAMSGNEVATPSITHYKAPAAENIAKDTNLSSPSGKTRLPPILFEPPLINLSSVEQDVAGRRPSAPEAEKDEKIAPTGALHASSPSEGLQGHRQSTRPESFQRSSSPSRVSPHLRESPRPRPDSVPPPDLVAVDIYQLSTSLSRLNQHSPANASSGALSTISSSRVVKKRKLSNDAYTGSPVTNLSSVPRPTKEAPPFASPKLPRATLPGDTTTPSPVVPAAKIPPDSHAKPAKPSVFLPPIKRQATTFQRQIPRAAVVEKAKSVVVSDAGLIPDKVMGKSVDNAPPSVAERVIMKLIADKAQVPMVKPAAVKPASGQVPGPPNPVPERDPTKRVSDKKLPEARSIVQSQDKVSPGKKKPPGKQQPAVGLTLTSSHNAMASATTNTSSGSESTTSTERLTTQRKKKPRLTDLSMHGPFANF
ncbi:hypothetical protein V1517DRAFT_154750 [Lipomyces orientalis]|uniref:Uncharacterized protein n=1 Tax=Lipomyces orientalis TaxID=1233043 RepID=A0ACC3TMH5_9ASCO